MCGRLSPMTAYHKNSRIQQVIDTDCKDSRDGSVVRGADRLRVATGKKSVGDAGGFYRS